MTHHPAARDIGATAHEREMRRSRRLAALTLAGIAAYVGLDIIAQLLPPHYNPLTQPESDLAVGPYGFVMAINFVVRGLLSLALLASIQTALIPAARSRVGAVLLEIWAIGAFLLAIFPTDVGARHTLHGLIHLIVALVAFVAAAVGALLISLRMGADPAWVRVRPALLVIAVASLVALAGLVLGVGSVASTAAGGIAGLFGLIERVFLGLILLWMLVTALRLVRLPHSAAA